MQTRNLNTRIIFFNNEGGQNDDGEVIEAIRKDKFSCWAEISKSTVKEFRNRYKTESSNLNLNEMVEVFIIRYHLLSKLDNTMFIDFNGIDYQIEKIEPDHARREHILISAKAVR